MKKINSGYLNNRCEEERLFEYLAPYVTEHKKTKFDQILNQRTRNLTIVLEDIFKSHNASAVMRTAECLGIQDVHIIEQENDFDFNPYVLRGAGKWLSFHQYKQEQQSNITSCFTQLKEKGYQIYATSPHGSIDYRNIQVEPGSKIALVFGSEENGVSSYVEEHADQLITIPMTGFTESFNISVSAAIIAEYYARELRKGDRWQLSEEEKFSLRLDWYQKAVSKIDLHLKHFHQHVNP